MSRGFLRSSIKVVNVRNPWDLVVSAFHWETKIVSPEFDYFRTWLQGHRAPRVNVELPDEVDDSWAVIRFEKFESQIRSLVGNLQLGVPGEIKELKGGIRPQSVPYWDYYDSRSRDQVADQYRDWIAAFGYRFGED